MFLVHFWTIFPIVGAKKIFSGTSGSATHNFIWFLAPCQNLEKTENTRTDGRTEGRTDGRTDRPYFIGPLRLPSGVQNGALEICSKFTEEHPC